MFKTFFACILLMGFSGLASATSAADKAIERGEYLVRGIAGCGNCHTPIGPEGFVMEQELAGTSR